jgi:hypothetical protein
VLTKLEAYSSWLDAPTLSLSDSGREETDLIQIRGITGLDPVKATVNTAPFGTVDGVAYTGSDVAFRNIVLTLHPNPDWDTWSFEALRRVLYSYFMPKLLTRLVFYSDDIPPVEIYGYVEDYNVNQFSSDLEIQVSIICPDPYFTALNATILTGVSNQAEAQVQYNGTIETGFNVELTRIADPPPNNITISVRDTSTPFVVQASVDSTKYFVMNSTSGQKYVRNVALANGIITNLLPNVAQGSVWPTLQPGKNNFAILTDSPGNQDYQLTYFERYGGL